jgi:hypothetical protein
LTPDELAKERHRLQKQGPRRMHTYGGHESNSGDDANTPSDRIAKSTRDVAVSNIVMTNPMRDLSETPLSEFHDAIDKVDSASTMSELTNRSGNSWFSSNPLGSYLREVEERTRRRKEEEIAEVRRVSALLLKPKQFLAEHQDRLHQLRAAKAQRMRAKEFTNVPTSAASSPSRDIVVDSRQRLLGGATALRMDNPRHQVKISIGLLVFLFVLLYPGRLWRFPTEFFVDSSPWWLRAIDDVVTVAYIALCAAVHFALCDICFLYAFEALEIGAKSGAETKRYYGSKVRLSVLLFSGGIAGLNIMKAVGVAVSIVGASYLKKLLVATLNVLLTPDYAARLFTVVGRTIPRLTSLFLILYRFISGIVLPLLSAAVVASKEMAIALLRNSIGGEAGYWFLDRMWRLIEKILSWSQSFWFRILDSTHYSTPAGAWRYEAWQGAQVLFSYSAVFLVSGVFLFQYSVQRDSNSAHQKKEAKSTATIEKSSIEKTGKEDFSIALDAHRRLIYRTYSRACPN